MSPYVTFETRELPRLPYEANLDLTYRCNNNCRHCWLWLPSNAPEGQAELSFDEIKRIADEARGLGCRRWSISGGEPMLRPDFVEIFDYLTVKAQSYSLNTNGSLITPEIAQLMTRRGFKMVALYGATAEVHDHITRNPSSFEATMQGFAYLKEVGAGFVVQIVPMRDNYHQFQQMVDLALSLSPHYRIGAPWLYMSASGSRGKNREIAKQRLEPRDVVTLDPPDLNYEEWSAKRTNSEKADCMWDTPDSDDRLFASCIGDRRDFHVDPYGQASFCAFIKDPALRYDLRVGSVEECWNHYIPSLADRVRGGKEYRENCGSCKDRLHCRWCAVYGFLEQRRFSAPVQYLCAVARENHNAKEDWKHDHRRFFQIAGITVQFDSDLPITDGTFHRSLKAFQVAGAGADTVTMHHHFGLPSSTSDYGKLVYKEPPWAIFKGRDFWTYVGILPGNGQSDPYQVAVFNPDHSRAQIYNGPSRERFFRRGDLTSLAIFSTDQVWLARLFADRQGLILHSSAVVLDGRGLLFVGHSEAGKSTIAGMLKDNAGAEILCDDRNIVRRWPDGFKVHGTWSHGTLPDVSATAAPLHALFFLEQAEENRLLPVAEKRDKVLRLTSFLVKPFEDADWWNKELDLVEQLAAQVPFFVLRFDRSGAVVPLLEALR